MGISLVMFTDKGERRSFPVKGSKAVIGRTRECDIQIQLAEVSRRQCELEVSDARIVVRDLGSSNGTYVNNKRVQESELSAGETLTVGPVIFTVVVDGKPTVIKPIRTIVGRKKNPAAKPVDDETESIDLDDSAALEALEEKKNNPLAQLEALSKQKGKL